MPWVLLALSVLWLVFSVNALWPTRRHRPLIVQSFFAGWFAAEAPLHWLALELGMAAVLVALGALDHWSGWLALPVCIAAWAILLRLQRVAEAAKDVVEHALSSALGPDYRADLRPECQVDLDLPPGRLLVPVWLTDPAVRVIKNIPYAPGGRRRMLDIYLPRTPVANAPVLFQIHGGAWAIGHKAQQARPLLHYMAARGFVCVSINYRLSPWVKWPAHLIDAKLALAWVKQHITEYGGDPEFVVCTGGSAGGHLTAMLALTPNDPRFQPDVPDVDTSVQAAIPFYAPYDFLDRERTQQHGGMRMFVELVVMQQRVHEAEELFRTASPLSHVRADAPPFFVIHGKNDSLTSVEEARLFVSRLREVSRAPVAFAELPFAQHAFDVFHSARTLHTIRAVHRFAEVAYAHHRRTKQPTPVLSDVRALVQGSAAANAERVSAASPSAR